MQKFQARRRIREMAYSWPVLLLLFIVLLIVLRGVWGAYGKYTTAQDALAKTRSENELLKTRKAELEEKSMWLETDRGVEEQIRSNFQVARPGEEVLIVVDEATSTEIQAEEKASWWEQWILW